MWVSVQKARALLIQTSRCAVAAELVMTRDMSNIRRTYVGRELASNSRIPSITSISTGMFPGSEPTPTAERACRPMSPNTATRRSEQPLITAGCSVNSGVAFTKPNTLITRVTRFREPRRVRIVDSMFNAVSLAASWAAATVRSRPTLPTTEEPSRRTGPWPEVYPRSPNCTNVTYEATGSGASGRTSPNSSTRRSAS